VHDFYSPLPILDFVINNGAQHTGEYTSKLTPKSFINLSTGVAQSLVFCVMVGRPLL
jgi:hypothetical protein